jgi:mono/diheme cytochrome c family protein
MANLTPRPAPSLKVPPMGLNPVTLPRRRPHPVATVLALLALLSGWAGVMPAQAQDATRGATLYQQIIVTGKQTCAAAACHGSSPAAGQNKISRGNSAYNIQAGIAGVGQMTFLGGRLSDGQLNDLAAYIAQATGKAPVYLPTPGAPSVSLSSTSLSYGSVTVGASSSLTSTLTNSGTAALNLSTISSSNAVFAVGNNCPASLAVGSSCTLTVTFSPAAVGAASGTVSIRSDAASSPDTLSLSGSGVAAPTGLLGWVGHVTALTFPSTEAGKTSPVQTLTLTNSGTATATLTQVGLTGSQASEFRVSGSCAAGLSLVAGAQCSVGLAMAPTSEGSKSAALAVLASNASNPPAIALTGTATAVPPPPPGNYPALSLSSTNLSFGSVTVGTSSSLTSTLTNSGTAALNLSAISASNALFAVTNNCPASLAVASSCTLTVSFSPLAAGGATGSVSIRSDAASSPDTLNLSGSGVTAPTALLGWVGNVRSLTFPSTEVGQTSASQTLTLTNSGNATATLTQISLSGGEASEFLVSGGCATGVTLAAGAQCTVVLAMAPSSEGSKTASLDVLAANASYPPAIALSGTATAVQTPPPPVPVPGDGGSNSNQGGGGCTLGSTHTLFDPLWLLMLVWAGGILIWRRRQGAHHA